MSDIEYDWRYDDDNNMTDDEWEEFQNELNIWFDNIRQQNLTKDLVDVDDLITDWLLMDETTKSVLTELTPKEINTISKRLEKKRKEGNVCNLYKRVGIKYLGDKGKLKYVWEKDYYDKHFGIQSGKTKHSTKQNL